jgi:hypothetical protein
MTNVDFKKAVIKSLVGSRLDDVPDTIPVVIHKATRSEGDVRKKCAYCSTIGKVRRTRFFCAHLDCDLPFCSIGNGRVSHDCFTLAHSNESIRKAVVQKYEAMKKSCTNKAAGDKINKILLF